MAKVSILMNAYNSEEYLKEAIDSVFSQTFCDWEIVFIDNCSTDNTKKIVKSYDYKIKYYKTEKNIPLGAARNFGLQYCQSEYLAFLDTDDGWEKDFLEISLNTLSQSKNSVAMTYSNITFINENSDTDKKLFSKEMPSGRIFKNLIKGYFIPMVSVVVRRSVVSDVGDCFNTNFLLIPDLELFTNIAYNHDIEFINKVLCKVRKHASSLTSTSFQGFPLETKEYIQTLRNKIDDFDALYAKELNFLYDTLDYQLCLANWMNNDNQLARQMIKKKISKRKKYLIVYLFMFFPYSFFEKVMKIFKVGNY